MRHLFVDISSHGLGHLAQTAPILNALGAQRPLQLTLRSGLSQAQLARRIQLPFTHIHAASDFGFVMQDALQIDRAASAERYRETYAEWPQRVVADALLLKQIAPDLVLSNVSPLPLAGAAQASIPALGMCSLNWADLFAHYYAQESWAAPIQAAMQAAYASATAFLRLMPGMPMATLPRLKNIGPVSGHAQHASALTRAELAQALDLPLDKRWLLLALGGIAHRLPIENWPSLPGIQLLVPADWAVQARADITPYSETRLPFTTLFQGVDAVLTKPGYGTFVEAAAYGLPVLYLQRPDWPESEHLEDWLQQHARASLLTPEQAHSGVFHLQLEEILQRPPPPRPAVDGVESALRLINELLDRDDTIAP